MYFNDATHLLPGLAKLRQLPRRRRARGRPQLGPAQRRHRQPQGHQEPGALPPDAAGHEPGRSGHGRNRRAERHRKLPRHRAARGSAGGDGRVAQIAQARRPARTWSMGGCPKRRGAARSSSRAPTPAAPIATSRRCSPTCTPTTSARRIPSTRKTRSSTRRRCASFGAPAPYLHDGSAATIRDVLTTRNPKDEHGKTSQLSRAAD